MKDKVLTESVAQPFWAMLYILISMTLLLDAFVFDFAVTTWLGLG